MSTPVSLAFQGNTSIAPPESSPFTRTRAWPRRWPGWSSSSQTFLRRKRTDGWQKRGVKEDYYCIILYICLHCLLIIFCTFLLFLCLHIAFIYLQCQLWFCVFNYSAVFMYNKILWKHDCDFLYLTGLEIVMENWIIITNIYIHMLYASLIKAHHA